MREIWKPIDGWPGYFISTRARVKSTRNNRNIIIKPQIYFGYPCVGLWNGKKRASARVHRLVAIAFIPNPKNLPCVHHKNHIRSDCRIKNLEWVTQSQNITYAYATGGRLSAMKGVFGDKNKKSVPILIYTKCGKFIEKIVGINEAARKYNAYAGHIVRAAQGKLKTHKNLIWRYE